VVTRYQPTTRRFRPRRLSSGQTVLELFNHTVAAQRLGGKAFGILKQVSLSAIGLTGPRPDAREAAAAILEFSCANLDQNGLAEQHTPRRLPNGPTSRRATAARTQT
jgi:hypothetical protein